MVAADVDALVKFNSKLIGFLLLLFQRHQGFILLLLLVSKKNILRRLVLPNQEIAFDRESIVEVQSCAAASSFLIIIDFTFSFAGFACRINHPLMLF